MKTQITGKTQLKISALSKNVPGTYFYEVHNWNRGSQFQNEVISHATQKKKKKQSQHWPEWCTRDLVTNWSDLYTGLNGVTY